MAKLKIATNLVLCFMLTVFSAIFFACSPVEESEAFINVAETLTVEVGESVELQYDVNPQNCLVTFRTIGEEVFRYSKVDGKDMIIGISVGSSKLCLSAIYKQQTSSVIINIVVVNKQDSGQDEIPTNPQEPTPPVRDPLDQEDEEKSGNDKDMVFDMGNRISVEFSGLGVCEVNDELVIVTEQPNFFTITSSPDFNIGEVRAYITFDEEIKELGEQSIYILPDFEVEEYFLIIQIREDETNIIYRKVYKVVFQTDLGVV